MVVKNDEPKDMDPTEEMNNTKGTDEVEAEETAQGDASEVDERIKELEDRCMRLQADYSNFRRRSGEEKQQMHLLGMEKLALDILPILDNFERALATDDVKDEKFYEGMRMIADQFRSELAKNDIVEIEALDEPFDPSLHHAVMTEEKEGVEADRVIAVLQKGYKLKDRVIRPAMVKVSK
ncbi:MAG: nucleotide exchange factor GrpE [Peptoniphilus sp.]|nr:nucleotide exchange factor GrpE [Peptoniphilus sp.]MDY3118869.1 nucleotide exchange factor GrpE [Peptoniphilus sp.]